ncbi:L-fucose kinase-like [Anneissia japonica]|uniref:L-fucose kinase-like n=1 Tax=Anneissia japonica TaxID=1529436 RepID=UPI0014255857|nr:L-fucose kinase-like [Anneissia japonica]
MDSKLTGSEGNKAEIGKWIAETKRLQKLLDELDCINEDGQYVRKRAQWTAIALTCRNKVDAHVYQRELEMRKKKGLIDKNVVIVTVEDPEGSVGSGGATLNALLVLAEHLSAKKNFTVLNVDVLSGARILILHVGSDYVFDACSKAFVTLPVTMKTIEEEGYDSLVCNLDYILHFMTFKIAVNAPPGVWVCSTEMLLNIPDDVDLNWKNFQGVRAITVPASVEYALNHGVYKIDKEGQIEDIIYKGKANTLQQCALPDGKVPLVAGIVFLSEKVSEKLASFCVTPPLDACTFNGLDSGVKLISLSLFFDVLLCMASEVNEEDFISGNRMQKRNTGINENELDKKNITRALSLIWKNLRGIRLQAELIQEGSYNYFTKDASEFRRYLMMCPLQSDQDKFFSWTNRKHCHIQKPEMIDEPSVVINSVLEGDVKVGVNCVISHCKIKGNMNIGKNSMLYGVDLTDFVDNIEFDAGIVFQGFNIQLGGERKQKTRVYTIMGKMDHLQNPFVKGKLLFCNEPWVMFSNRTGILAEDLWAPDLSDYDQTLFNAKLFPVWHHTKTVGIQEVLWLVVGKQDPVMLARWRSSWRLSFEDIMCSIDHANEFDWRRELFYEVSRHHIWDVLQNGTDDGLQKLFKSLVTENYADQLLDVLDEVASTSSSNGVAARTLVCIAGVLGALANNEGGLRSGPAANTEWQPAFQLLESERIAEGVKLLKKVRSDWMNQPVRLVRAARHYEGAAQILIRHAVMSARNFISTTPCEPPAMGKWVTVSCPARIDISGGWSDTPPITYESGGAVIDAAIQLNGKRPIGAKCKKIPEPHISLVLKSNYSPSVALECNLLDDLQDYNNPQAPGALLKAAFICAEVVAFPSDVSLSDQLQSRYGGGFELHTWSDVPHGSGLGTSSILAGAVIAVLWRISGKSYDHSSLIHAVLHFEQILTTGGGWQDQVGGLTGGINIGHCKAGLPLKVDITHVDISDNMLAKFNNQFVLVYTGKTRLARNLLQEVVRNWYARIPQVVDNVQNLKTNAWLCFDAFKEGNLEKIGACMNTYWEQKKILATGCEPSTVKNMMDALRPHAYGQILAGAGGGGFLCVVTKEINGYDVVKTALKDFEDEIEVFKVVLDQAGILVEVEE